MSSRPFFAERVRFQQSHWKGTFVERPLADLGQFMTAIKKKHNERAPLHYHQILYRCTAGCYQKDPLSMGLLQILTPSLRLRGGFRHLPPLVFFSISEGAPYCIFASYILTLRLPRLSRLVYHLQTVDPRVKWPVFG